MLDALVLALPRKSARSNELVGLPGVLYYNRNMIAGMWAEKDGCIGTSYKVDGLKQRKSLENPWRKCSDLVVVL